MVDLVLAVLEKAGFVAALYTGTTAVLGLAVFHLYREHSAALRELAEQRAAEQERRDALRGELEAAFRERERALCARLDAAERKLEELQEKRVREQLETVERLASYVDRIDEAVTRLASATDAIIRFASATRR